MGKYRQKIFRHSAVQNNALHLNTGHLDAKEKKVLNLKVSAASWPRTKARKRPGWERKITLMIKWIKTQVRNSLKLDKVNLALYKNRKKLLKRKTALPARNPTNCWPQVNSNWPIYAYPQSLTSWPTASGLVQKHIATRVNKKEHNVLKLLLLMTSDTHFIPPTAKSSINNPEHVSPCYGFLFWV